MIEGVKKLIEKLNGQVAQNASPEQLLTTVQLLQNELMGSIRKVEVLGTSGIAVFVPNVKPVGAAKVIEKEEPAREEEKEYFELILDTDDLEDGVEEQVNGIPSYEEVIQLQKVIREQDVLLDRLNLSDMTTDELSRLNTTETRFNTKMEPFTVLNKREAIIKDLRTGISAQDKVSFVRELFRGDETAFDRSIRTIENFNTIAEAEYWIQRELKTKNGWLYNNPVVQQFEQIIKKRFA